MPRWFGEGSLTVRSPRGGTGMAGPATGEGGGQRIYSAIAIKTGLALHLVFDQSLRQTEVCCGRSPMCSGSRSPSQIIPP